MTGAPGSGVETEIKLRVDGEAALEAVARVAGGMALGVIRQVNHFFDTPQKALNVGKFVLRLREESGRFFLAAKGPQTMSVSGALSSRAEEEIVLDPPTAQAILDGRQDALQMLADSPGSTEGRRALLDDMRKTMGGGSLREVGAFETTRTHWPHALHVGKRAVSVILELDVARFPGNVVHHELEVEIPQGVDAAAAEEAVEALLAKAGVKGWAAPSKAARFFAALDGKLLD